MTRLTKEQEQVKDALYQLWFDHYTDDKLTIGQRNQLVEDFAVEWLDSSKIKLEEAVYYHPMNVHKRRYDGPRYTAMDILADFIIRADMREERREEYPVTHGEQELTNEDDRRKNELGIYSNTEENGDERVPYGYVTEEGIIAQIYKPKSPPSVERVRHELAKIKENAGYWAATLSEEYGYDEADALNRIKALKLERVKECRVCGSGFYAHDMRRQVCDQQHGIDTEGKRTKKSACENIYQKNYNKEHYEKSVS